MNKQIPNILTVSRIFLAIGFIRCLWDPQASSIFLATVLFVLASLSDFYDGYYAKKYKLTSNFGKIMDPIADKILILSAFFMFVPTRLVPLWMFYVIFVREMFVTGTRLAAIRKGEFIAAEKAGKAKTVSQMTVILLMLGVLALQHTTAPFAARPQVEALGLQAVSVLMVVTVWLTLISGLLYLWNNRKILFSNFSF